MNEDLTRHLEETRTERRERARQRVADGWTPPVPEKPAKPAKQKVLTFKQLDRAIARHRKECEAMLADAAADSGLDPDEFWVDIVRGYEATAEWELPIVRTEFLRGYGLDDD